MAQKRKNKEKYKQKPSTSEEIVQAIIHEGSAQDSQGCLKWTVNCNCHIKRVSVIENYSLIGSHQTHTGF